ncbi:hypothetical protein EMCRGX_G000583 [Ephydatia muelleri]
MDAPSVRASILFALLVCTFSLPTKHDTAAEGGRSWSGDDGWLWAAHAATQKRSAATPSLDVMWPAGKVPYVFDDRVAHEGILAAMDHISNVTCIEFVPRTVETVYVNFTQDPQYCNTPRGRNPYLSFLPTYRGQPVQLTRACANSTGVVLNLLGSTLGMWAEHLRPDRDRYVTVLWDVVVPSRRAEYNINPNIDTSSNTMELKVAYEGVVGQREGLSSLDISKIGRMYGCPVFETTTPLSSSPSPLATSAIPFTTSSPTITPSDSSTMGVSPTQEITTETSTVPGPTDNISSGPARDAIRLGSQIALKLLTKEGDGHLWLGCTGTACTASECPGPTFPPERTVLCQEYIYLVRLANMGTRAYNDDMLRTGDQVVLMQLGGSTLYCNQTTFSCMMLPDCRDKSGKFSGEMCGNAVLVVRAPDEGAGTEITPGQVVRDGDDIMLDYVVKSVPLLEWKDTLYCHPKEDGHCERRYCSDISLLDQYTPDGRYDNGCRLIYTVFKLPS